MHVVKAVYNHVLSCNGYNECGVTHVTNVANPKQKLYENNHAHFTQPNDHSKVKFDTELSKTKSRYKTRLEINMIWDCACR